MKVKATTELSCFEQLKSSFKLIAPSTNDSRIYWLCTFSEFLQLSSY